MGPLDRFAFVLFKPKASGNVGAAARALKNMGLRDMRLVAPASRGGLAGRSMAVHGRDVLDNARVFAELGAAVEDCGLVVGTTCRGGRYRRAAQPIGEAADDLIRIGTVNRVAVIFGPEDFGLTNREIKLCQRLVTIPAAPDYPSLNLAQAVMVVAYELMMAAGAAGTEKDAALSAPAMAPAATVDAMLARMTDALLSIGFLSPDNPDHIMFAVRAMLGRSGVTQRECDILNGIASQILWFGSGGHETIASKGRTGRRIR